MRELIAFFLIARRTGEDDIADIVGTTATNRHNMFNVVLYQLLMAVVALLFLSLILCFNLLSSVGSTCRKLAGAPAMLTGKVALFTALTLLVTHLVRFDNLRIFFFEGL